jgi:hypothetical protein
MSRNAFVHFEPQVAFNQIWGLSPLQIIQVWHPQASDFQNVSKATCGEQSGTSTTSLQDRVGGYRRAMNNVGYRLGPNSRTSK